MTLTEHTSNNQDRLGYVACTSLEYDPHIKETVMGCPLVWVLPSAVGIPAISIWIHSYRRKFGELSPRPASAP